MAKAKPKPRTLDVVFYLADPATKEVIGGEKSFVSIPMEADFIAGAAMKLHSAAAIMAANETERRQDAAFREIMQAIGETVWRNLAVALKKHLHP